MPRKSPLPLIAILIFLLGAPTVTFAKPPASKLPKLIFFYSHNCPTCIKIRNELMPQIEQRYKDKLEIDYRDTFVMENYQLFLKLQEQYGNLKINKVPTIFLNGHFLAGEEQIRNNLVRLIEGLSGEISRAKEIDLGSVNLEARFQTLTPWLVVFSGFIDGVNPCAFTVIVFFISFLALQGYRRRELTVIGLFFIFAVFITYLLIGLGIFNFLYRLKEFFWVRRIVNYSIGILCIGLGIAAGYDFLKFRKTGSSEGLLLQLPQAVKSQIHRLVGLHYRSPQGQISGPAKKVGILGLLLSALITGFLVSLLEAVCTGQTYLPTIIFVFRTTPLKLKAWAYLLLYNLMFIAPLLLIFLFALLGVTSEQFSRMLKKHLSLIKMLMALLFFTFGIFLIWKA